MIEKKTAKRMHRSTSRMRALKRVRDRRTIDRSIISTSLAAISLQDMITASRIVAAHEDGITADIKLCSDKAQRIAEHVIANKPTRAHIRGISNHQLNKAIIERNKIENKPTKETIAIYKEMMSEE